MYIMKLSPAFKDYLWGGNRLESEFGYKSGFDKAAEAWVLSCHKDGQNIVQNGEFTGQSLSDVIKLHPEYIGTSAKEKGDFPILIKFIDALDNLSLQVHPDENYANEVENEHGKTECWYILDCTDDAELILGFNKKTEKDEIDKSIKDNTILEKVKHIKVKKGEIYFIPAGTVHAICKGLLIAEVQQNSNSTYRVFDYNRIGADGKTRPLHIKKAVDVMNGEKLDVNGEPCFSINYDGYCETRLIECDIFRLDKIDVNGTADFVNCKKSFTSIVVIDGSGKINTKDCSMDIKKGGSVFLPAGIGKYTLSGNFSCLITTLP